MAMYEWMNAGGCVVVGMSGRADRESGMNNKKCSIIEQYQTLLCSALLPFRRRRFGNNTGSPLVLW